MLIHVNKRKDMCFFSLPQEKGEFFLFGLCYKCIICCFDIYNNEDVPMVDTSSSM